jgi:hypothetical protein
MTDPRTGPDGSPQAWSATEIAAKAADLGWVETTRKHLRCLGL